MSEDWSALEQDVELDEDKASDAQKLQEAIKGIDNLMYDLVTNQKAAMEFLFTRYVIDSDIAQVGDDLLQIGIRQGKVELLRWIYDRAERTQIKQGA